MILKIGDSIITKTENSYYMDFSLTNLEIINDALTNIGIKVKFLDYRSFKFNSEADEICAINHFHYIPPNPTKIKENFMGHGKQYTLSNYPRKIMFIIKNGCIMGKNDYNYCGHNLRFNEDLNGAFIEIHYETI